ncbi:helix-turn-helix domain-containing protein [Flavihumibacter petaseus]|uniref:Putative AraC family transcriptional regulator n=1 Tax=Flavihumibacter petaseus NBRC 106054 TaxID=1220578 RepID=A0A0E9MVK7_9BACT|nr:AraC family transcriptional regulator [Flavihumibacter petaseus]GAO41792.1 putative AraC family transcriptional regulator [Flavihumibacter petaseus NBRC 106054]
MTQPAEILAMARKEPVMFNELELLQQKEQQIPGSVKYTIYRYRKVPQWSIEDIGMLVYNRESGKSKENFLELRFCISGNMYCQEKESECRQCKFNQADKCENKVASVDVLSFVFTPTHLSQFSNAANGKSLPDDVIRFRHTQSFSKAITLCSRTRTLLDTLLRHDYSGSMENIFINAQMQMLLLYSLECMVGEKEELVFTCKFLANETDREKIARAREVLLQHICEPITIRELSRKVAINECYLKKGFKELYGTTVFDFYQVQRMEHARYLLYEKGLSVTEVSMMLGYSSISHFSTAFKKHTGIKPCELLLH